MGGLIKGIGKVFSAVGHFIKKFWKPIVIAVAAYFTMGAALAYFGSAGVAATAAEAGATTMADAATVAATTTAAESGAAIAADIGTTATAEAGASIGAGLAGEGAAAVGDTLAGGAAAGVAETGAAAASDLGASAASSAATAGGGVGVPGAMANAIEGTTMGAAGDTGAAAAADAAATGAQSGADIASDIGTGAQAEAGQSIGDSVAAQGGSTSMLPESADLTGGTAGTPTVPNALAATSPDSSQGFWNGMSGGQKAQLAATLLQGAAGFFQPGPTRAQQGLWPGGPFFGQDQNGNGVNLGNVYNNAMTGGNAPTAVSGGVTQQATTPTGQTAAQGAAQGSDFLPAASQGASTAQATTKDQQNTLSQASQRNAEFINSTLQRLAPNGPARKSG